MIKILVKVSMCIFYNVYRLVLDFKPLIQNVSIFNFHYFVFIVLVMQVIKLKHILTINTKYGNMRKGWLHKKHFIKVKLKLKILYEAIKVFHVR